MVLPYAKFIALNIVLQDLTLNHYPGNPARITCRRPWCGWPTVPRSKQVGFSDQKPLGLS